MTGYDTPQGDRTRARILEEMAEIEMTGAIASVRAIADAVPLGVSTVHRQLQVMAERGLVEQFLAGRMTMYRRRDV